MAETDWRKVVNDLKRLCTQPTEQQQALAAILAVPVDLSTPAPVAAALLRAHLRVPLDLAKARAFGESEYEYLRDLVNDTGLAIPCAETLPSRDLLASWILVAQAQRSILHSNAFSQKWAILLSMRLGESTRDDTVRSPLLVPQVD
ncbi:hypothetical protein ACWCOT_07115 [Nonomuraea bangladeshensis]